MKSLAAALIAAQGDMPAVEKNAVNPHFGSRFVSLDHLIARTKPVLTKHGLAIVQFPATTALGAPALTTTLIHGESGEQLSGTVPLVLAKQDMQGLGAALTYARRYGWASALAISDEDDDDGNAASSPAPGTGASQVSGSAAVPGGASSGRVAVTEPPPASPAAPISDDGWTYPFGKHKGKTVAVVEVDDPGWHDWFLQNSDKDDIKARINEHRNLAVLTDIPGSEFVDDIPFDRTIDGIGG